MGQKIFVFSVGRLLPDHQCSNDDVCLVHILYVCVCVFVCVTIDVTVHEQIAGLLIDLHCHTKNELWTHCSSRVTTLQKWYIFAFLHIMPDLPVVSHIVTLDVTLTLVSMINDPPQQLAAVTASSWLGVAC